MFKNYKIENMQKYIKIRIDIRIEIRIEIHRNTLKPYSNIQRHIEILGLRIYIYIYIHIHTCLALSMFLLFDQRVRMEFHFEFHMKFHMKFHVEFRIESHIEFHMDFQVEYHMESHVEVHVEIHRNAHRNIQKYIGRCRHIQQYIEGTQIQKIQQTTQNSPKLENMNKNETQKYIFYIENKK